MNGMNILLDLWFVLGWIGLSKVRHRRRFWPNVTGARLGLWFLPRVLCCTCVA